MKRLLLTSLAALLLLLPVSGAGIEAITYNNLVSSISRPRAPVVSGRYIIFTASGTARHTGIAFEHENYRNIHSYQRIIRKDADGKPQRDENGKLQEPVLFYIAEIPPEMHEIRYRMVIDGLWTTDPLNAETAYDYPNGMNVSLLPVEYYEIFQTSNVSKGQVRFTYTGETGKTVRLAGSFNNWDPFMYEMTERKPGEYELVLPLPRGTWYYAYFEGTEQLPDNTNHNRVYTRDGKIASVVTVE
jgi:Carbohydrate-binding module 48 (Isoamylase N-terminal domain).